MKLQFSGHIQFNLYQCFLQADRLRRMMGDEIANNSQQQAHMSADDLNDGFILDNDDKKTLAYQVGEKSPVLYEIA